MTPAQLLQATQGDTIPGWMQVCRIADETKMMAVYRSGTAVVVGFGGTRDSLRDWLNNLNPIEESRWYISELRKFLAGPIYTVITAGHSQGGYHAEIVGKFLDAEIVTFGGYHAGVPATHYLTHADPMAWIPFFRKGTTIKLGTRVLFPQAQGHYPGTYFKELEKCRNFAI